MGGRRTGIDADTLANIADEIVAVHNEGVEIVIVVGGGNIFRGVTAATEGMDRVTADHMGMLATVINALALQDALERRGAITRVTTAITMSEFAEPFIRRRAIRHLEKGRIVICAAGTGNPFFHDRLRRRVARERVEVRDHLQGHEGRRHLHRRSHEELNAERLPHVTYQRVLADRLEVMDASAIDLARGSSIPIYIFSLRERGNIRKALLGEGIGSIVTEEMPVEV